MMENEEFLNFITRLKESHTITEKYEMFEKIETVYKREIELDNLINNKE